VEEEVLGPGIERAARTAAIAGENAKLKRLVADLSLDRHMLQEIVQKKL
jgi:putative transposase